MRRLLSAALCLLLVGVILPAAAQSAYPTRPIRLIVGFSAGGTADVLARLLAEEIRKDWGQPVIVDNRVGASGAIGANLVAKSTPDGYTLLVATATHTGIAALKKQQLPYDSVKDFTPITMVVSAPIVLLARSDSPFKTLASYIAAAKAKPGEITYATSGIGGSLHLAAEQFAFIAGVKLNHVPYKGANEVVTAVLSGAVHSSWNAANAAVPLVAAGKLHILGVASDQRSSLLPDTPTLQELGVKGMRSDTWIGIMGPASLPGPVIKTLDDELQKVISRPEVREKIIKLGAEPAGLGPREFATRVRNEIEMLSEVVKKANIAPE